METKIRETKIPSQIVEIWQSIVDSVSSLLSVPSVMINRLEPPELEVFRSNTSAANPFPSGTRMPSAGIYCAAAAEKRHKLRVEDARKDPVWADSPTARAGIFAYLGYPVFWPSGEVFGTICAIDTKENKWLTESENLLGTFKEAIEAHLTLVDTLEKLRDSEKQIRIAHDSLEIRVEERTRELASANRQLKTEVRERECAQAEAVRAKEVAEKANRAKSEFLANMSHELRTPLNHIMGFTELLLGKTFGELNSTQEDYLKDVLGSSRHLLSLINDILDLSKVEAGRLDLELGDVDIKALVESSLMMLKEKSISRGIDFKVDMDQAPGLVRADERKLKQVMYNLLSNAVKFTPDGGEVSVRGESADEASVKVSVRDTGIGIETQDLDRIFRPFEQGDNSSSRMYQGTGLGLTLTKRFVELHGGKVWVESEGKGKGSSFFFTIPV